MRNSTQPSGPGQPRTDALDKTRQREGLDELAGQTQHSPSSTDRQPNLERPAQGGSPREPQPPSAPSTRH